MYKEHAHMHAPIFVV